MSEPMTPEVADALAAINAATHKRGYDKGFAEGVQAGIVAQRDFMLNAAKEAAEQAKSEPDPPPIRQPSQIVLVDEGGIERILEGMEHPDA